MIGYVWNSASRTRTMAARTSLYGAFMPCSAHNRNHAVNEVHFRRHLCEVVLEHRRSGMGHLNAEIGDVLFNVIEAEIH